MNCRNLMVGDWVQDEHNFPMQITTVGEDYAYATFEGLEGDPWEFDDKDCKPSPIEITPELLKANRWEIHTYEISVGTYTTLCYKKEDGNYLEWNQGTLSVLFDYEKDNDGVYSDILVPVQYVHQLQQVLRLAGMTELANNFKVWL